jgi:hypothetical protein
MSTTTLTDPKVVDLGERFGPIGPLVWTALMCHAGQQDSGGEVDLSFRTLAFETFSDEQTVKAVVEATIESGLCHAESRDGHAESRSVRVRLKAWKRLQATGRKARQREREKGLDQADVTDGHAESRDVTTDRQTDRQTEKNAQARVSPYDKKTVEVQV